MKKRRRPQRQFEFDIFTYPADGSPNDLTAGYTEQRATDEHSARREIVRLAHLKGLFIYSLALNQSNIDGGALCTA